MRPAAPRFHNANSSGQRANTRFLGFGLGDAHSVQKLRGNHPVYNQAMSAFIGTYRGTRSRAHNAIYQSVVVAELTQPTLHLRYSRSVGANTLARNTEEV